MDSLVRSRLGLRAHAARAEVAMSSRGQLDRGDGVKLAWSKLEGRSPTVVFLPGYGSDMTGDKATVLAAFCERRGQAMLRFDYSGHGASGGKFEDGTIGVSGQSHFKTGPRV